MLALLELQSFKCFELLRLPLAPLTLLTGLNASGKSTVLQAIALVHQTMREHEWSTRLVLNGASVRLGAVSDVTGEVRDSVGIALVDDENTYQWRFGGDRQEMSMDVRQVAVNGARLEAPAALRHLLPLDEADAAASFIRALRSLTYVSAERMPPQDSYSLEDPQLANIVGPRGEHAVSVLYWSRDEEIIPELVQSDATLTRLRQVESRMSTVFPGCEIDLQQAHRGHAVSLGLRTSKSTEFLNPVHTGFGLTQVLPIMVAALSAQKSDILLIENPEVHLHPAGQALMGKFLSEVAQAGVQVIVETHSDHVLNGVRRAVKNSTIEAEKVAIHFFRPPSGDLPQVLSPTIDASGNIDDWPDGFFDQFDKDASYFAGWTED